jgi:hypothetical protein
MVAKLQETEEALNAALLKAQSAEKSRNRLNGELEDALIDLEKVGLILSNIAERQKESSI